MTDSRPVFELRSVSKEYGATPALFDIDLWIGAGERVALVGPSGAGKSTLISLLNGTTTPTKGVVKVLGRDLTALSPGEMRKVQRQVGTIYQQFNLVDTLRVIHNVNAGHLGRWNLPKAILSLTWPQSVETALEALRKVGIPEKLYERTDQLSGGQQQRVAIARVLIQDPKAILADEPVASLDPERGREVLELLCDLTIHSGKTLVTSLHAIEFARSHFERVVGLRQGRVLFDCTNGDLTPAMIQALYKIEHNRDYAGDPAP